jgi:hypothetical protein
MTISTKLAVDFVKRNFNTFEFTSPMTKASAVTGWNVYEAHVRVNGADIELFDRDYGCVMVKLPEKLCGKLGLEEALKLIDKEDMDMDYYLHGKYDWVRVTTNRLLMLEKLMKKSGFINPINHDVKDLIAAKIAQMQSEASSTYANIVKQLDELWEMIKSK